jgi:hypothetical protein
VAVVAVVSPVPEVPAEALGEVVPVVSTVVEVAGGIVVVPLFPAGGVLVTVLSSLLGLSPGEGIASNVAVQDLATLVMSIVVEELVPAQSILQPVKVELALGVAVKVTGVLAR